MKICSVCKCEKPFEHFYTTQRGHKPACKPCARARAAGYRAEETPGQKAERAARDAAKRLANPEASRGACKKWREANREKVAADKKAYNAEHAVEIKAQREVYRATHREAIRAKEKEYQIAHRETIAAYRSAHQKVNSATRTANQMKREAAKLRATPPWANLFFVEEIYDLAARRTKLLGVEHHVDHIVPLRSRIVCGLHVENNLRVIPAVANLAKGNRHWPEMPA